MLNLRERPGVKINAIDKTLNIDLQSVGMSGHAPLQRLPHIIGAALLSVADLDVVDILDPGSVTAATI